MPNEQTEAEKAAAEKAAKAKRKQPAVLPAGYYVKEGRSITTRRGIKASEVGGKPARIEASDVSGGEKTIAALVKSGHLEKR